MDKYATIILALILSVLVLGDDAVNNTTNSTVETEEYQKQYQQSMEFLEELNLKNVDHITSDKFEKFIRKLLTKGEDVELIEDQKVFYDKVVEIMMKDIPEIIPVEDVGKYIASDKLEDGLNKAILELYGEEELNKFTKGDDNYTENEKDEI